MAKDTLAIINANLFKYFDTSKRISVISPGNQSNGFKINVGNTLEHELKKVEVVYELIKSGRSVVVEGVLKNNCRPDIVVVDLLEPIAYEIVCTETKESILKKSKKYPFRLMEINTNDKELPLL